MPRMSPAVKFAKQAEILEVCQTAVYAATNKVSAEYQDRGNTREDAMAFASGYIQSMFASLIADLPKKQREELVERLQRRAV
jgi:hypothetical protein